MLAYDISFRLWVQCVCTLMMPRRLYMGAGDLAQMVERSLSMREALGSMPRFSSYFLLHPCFYCRSANLRLEYLLLSRQFGRAV
jgi:hypothetical protein